MKAALIGLPQSGKSTVFSAVTGSPIDPYAAVEPHHAVVHMPDPRLAYVAKLFNPKKVTEATIEFVDVPGSALDDVKGQEQWRRLLPMVRQADLLVVVVREFENDSVPAYRDRIDARADFQAMWEELIFADLDAVTTRIGRIEAALKKPTRTHDTEKRELTLLTRCREALESEAPLASAVTTDEERRQVSSFAFLTEKPLVGIRNLSDDQATIKQTWEIPYVKEIIALSASIEAEIAALEDADRPAFLADLGLDALARDRLAQSCYKAGGLITFFTANNEEARAWAIRKGSTAVDAAAKVHTDLARGFIRAETVSHEDLVAYEDIKGVKAAGRMRKEGKTYVVEDGDLLHILAST